jgi:hypothetical protein
MIIWNIIMSKVNMPWIKIRMKLYKWKAVYLLKEIMNDYSKHNYEQGEYALDPQL